MTAAPQPEILAAFEAAKGFMPVDEGLALYAAAVEAGRLGLPLLEVGTYCGRSTILLADAARRAGVTALTVDHHRGSEEQQPGWDYHDPQTVDPEIGLMDTLPAFRRTLHKAGLEEHVVALVGRSPQIAALWNTPLALVFVDGGHTDEHAHADYAGWAPHVAPGGLLVIHDVFPDPEDEFTGQAPYRVYLRALESGEFTEIAVTGSLRVLRRTSPTAPADGTPAPEDQAPAPDDRVSAPGGQTPAPEGKTSAPDDHAPAPGGRASAPRPGTPAPGSAASAAARR